MTLKGVMTTKATKSSQEKLGFTGIPEGLSQEEIEVLQKLQVQLTDFVLHLIQAFLRTGYYTPEHPESKKAKEGLYQEFVTLFKVDEEITFYLREDPEGTEILVEGVLPELQRLSRMMMKGMGEIYIPRFAKYLERKELLCLTVKNRMGQVEFTRFVDIMSDPSHLDIRRKEDKQKFAEILYSHGIFNISFVHNDDLLAPDREMPWRARITLSRIRKDLRMVPYLQKLSSDQLQEIGRNLVRDAIRAVRQPDILCAILQNSDIAASPRNPEEAIEDTIINFVQPQPLAGASKFFLREHLGIKKQQKHDTVEEKSDRLLTKFAVRLKEIGTKEGEDLLEQFFRNDLIKLDDLPPRIREKILIERLTEKFLNYAEVFFKLLDQAKEKVSFLNVAHSFSKVIPELIRREKYPEVLMVIQALARHFHKKTMWALLAGQVLEEIGSGEIPTMLEEKFLTGKKEARIAIIPIFTALEVGAIPHLLNILRKSEDQWVRKNACEALIEIGPVAAVHLLEELKQEQVSLETRCDILRVLGEIKPQEWKGALLGVLRGYVSHENPKLREQAIHTYCLVGGRDGEETFLSCLADPDPEVQRRAAWSLGMIKSVNGLERMVDLLARISVSPSPQTETLETEIYQALGLSGNLSVGGRTVEQILLEAIEKRGMKQWWGLFDKHPLSDPSLETIVDALARMGTKESVKVLVKLEKTREDSLGSRIKEAVKKIDQREPSPKA